MAGHSKWSNIKHRKGAQDARRGKIFSKIGKEITVSAKLGGGDAESNPRLRTALAKARSYNMPKDNVERAIKKGLGELGDIHYSESVYEGYGAGGVAVLVECLTDNANRTVGEVRHAFSRNGGNLGTDGSVSYLFKKVGVIVFEKDKLGDRFDKLFEVASEHGAEDIDEQEQTVELSCPPSQFNPLRDALDQNGFDEPSVAEIMQIPDTYCELDAEKEESVRKLIDRLEDLDDVQNVYHNAQFSELDDE